MPGGGFSDSGVPPIMRKFSGLGQYMTMALPSNSESFELKLKIQKSKSVVLCSTYFLNKRKNEDGNYFYVLGCTI